jgi:hypothetical protein
MFDDNFSLEGGAVNTNLWDCSLRIGSSHFFRNYSSVTGGAIHIDGFGVGRIELDDVHFYKNSSLQGVGSDIRLHAHDSISIFINSCTSSDAKLHGGSSLDTIGEFIGCVGNSVGQVHIENSTFVRAEISLPSVASSGLISKSTFIDNGLITLPVCSSIVVNNSLFRNASLGIASFENDRHELVNCVFDMHGTPFSPLLVFSADTAGTTNVYNSIFWLSDSLQIGFLGIGGNITLRLLNCLVSRPSLDHALAEVFHPDFQPGRLDTASLLLGYDPGFLDPDDYDYRLKSCSPAINRGLNTIVEINQINQDFFGNSRIFDNFVDLGIHESTDVFSLSIDSIQNNDCINDLIGEIFFTAKGTSPLIPTLTDQNGNVFNSFGHLPEGEYQLHVEDGHQCLDSIEFHIDATPAVIASHQIDSVTCFGGSDGNISVSIESGRPEYQYLWSTGAVGPSLLSLVAGKYAVTITDSNGCTLLDSIIIPDGIEIDIMVSLTRPTSVFTKDGKITLTVSGANPPYQFQWDDGSDMQDRSLIGVGNYTVTVTDANDCSRMMLIDLAPSTGSSSDNVRLYPNPVSRDGPLTLEYINVSGSESILMYVTNALGQEILTENFPLVPGFNSMEIYHNFPDAVYYFHVMVGQELLFPIIVVTK